MDLKKFIKKTYYSISHAPEYWFEIEKSGDVTPGRPSPVKFKRKSGMYLSIGGVDVFRLQKYKGRLVIMNTATDKIYVPGRGMRVKTEMTSRRLLVSSVRFNRRVFNCGKLRKCPSRCRFRLTK